MVQDSDPHPGDGPHVVEEATDYVVSFVVRRVVSGAVWEGAGEARTARVSRARQRQSETAADDGARTVVFKFMAPPFGTEKTAANRTCLNDHTLQSV